MEKKKHTNNKKTRNDQNNTIDNVTCRNKWNMLCNNMPFSIALKQSNICYILFNRFVIHQSFFIFIIFFCVFWNEYIQFFFFLMISQNKFNFSDNLDFFFRSSIVDAFWSGTKNQLYLHAMNKMKKKCQMNTQHDVTMDDGQCSSLRHNFLFFNLCKIYCSLHYRLYFIQFFFFISITKK